MKRALWVLIFIVFLVLTAQSACSASETEGGILTDLGIKASGDLNFSSLYMWRGITLDGDAVIQPGLYLQTKESKLGIIKLGIWASAALENRDALKSDEIDYIFDYTYKFSLIDASFGHIYYDFPDVLPADGASKGFSREFYWGITFSKLLLTPSVFYYYDYGRKEDGGGHGSYTVVSLSHSIPVKAFGKYNCSIDLSGHAGFNNKQYYRGKGGDAALGAGFTLPLAKGLSMKPNINYSVPWGSISDKSNGNQKNRLYGGVYLNYAF